MRPSGPRTIGVLIVLSLVLAGVAFVVGYNVRSPAQVQARTKAPAPSLVTAPVRVSRAAITLVLRGTVTIAGTEVIEPPSSVSGDLPVVTASPYAYGSQVGAGDAVVAVANHPVIVMPGNIPAYRSLAYGDSGPDVAELQAALGLVGLSVGNDQAGSYGLGTAAAVAALYRRAGYAPPLVSAMVRAATGKPRVERLASVPLGEVVFVAHLPGRVLAAARVGSILKAGKPAAVLGTGAALIPITVNANEASLIRPGDSAFASQDVSGRALPGRISAVTRSRNATNTGAPRYVVTFVPDNEAAAGSLAGKNLAVTVRLRAHSTDTTTVPDAAVVTNASGRSYVIVLSHGKQRPVRVRVRLSYQGVDVVSPVGGALRNGETVVLGSGA